MDNKETLRIKAETLGTVEDIIKFLTDLEFAYNSLYTLDYVMESLLEERKRSIEFSEERLNYLKAISKEFNFKYSDIFILDYLEGYRNRTRITTTINPIDLRSKLDTKDFILPEDKLQISKVNIQSPGFWEIIGVPKIIKEFRLYLKDRHERQKDRKYRNKQEEIKGNIELYQERETLIQERIETLKKLGYSKAEIRQLIASFVTQPLDQLGQHQTNGLIEGPDED